jgi:hypothetical protein
MAKEIFGDELWAQIEPIVKEKGLNLIVDNKEKPEYIPKSRFDEVIGQKNLVKTQADELNQQLDSLKKQVRGNEELTKTIDDLQKKNSDWEAKYRNTLLQSAIKIRAVTDKAKDPEDLMKFLDMTKLEIDEQGTVKGLEEQLIILREQKPYLFDINNKTNTLAPQQPPNPIGGIKTEIEQLEEQYAQAQKSGNSALKIVLRNKIFELSKKQ